MMKHEMVRVLRGNRRGVLRRLGMVGPSLAAGVATTTALSAAELDEYVAADDGAFAFEVVAEQVLPGARALNVRLTSQEWRGIEWNHWMSVVIPPVIDDHGKAVLVIAGGSNRSEPPDAPAKEAQLFAAVAVRARAPLAVIKQVPNQPLFDGLKEDDLIAHTFQHYLDGGGDDWPLLLPMVKSVVRAMDAIEGLGAEGALGRDSAGGQVEPSEFIVGGASKRGWTTWLTAAADKRVTALFPMVIDVLNMDAQMDWQMKTYGRYSEMIEPYTERGIQDRLGSPEGRRLNRVVDPFHYRERITQPKLVLLGANDPYWTADAAQLYYHDLQGPRAIFYLPNAGHGLGLGILPTLNAFIESAIAGTTLPAVDSELSDGGALEVSWDRPGGTPSLWTAKSDNRDFREIEWVSSPVGGATADGCTVELEEPEDGGWLAAFVSVAFDGDRGGKFSLSTPIAVVPALFPYPAAAAGQGAGAGAAEGAAVGAGVGE